MSERRACDVLNQPRSTQRYEAKPRDDGEPETDRADAGLSAAGVASSAIAGSGLCCVEMHGGPATRGCCGCGVRRPRKCCKRSENADV